MQAYNDAGDDRNFEVVLFGHDTNHDLMVKYMTDSKMPFPGIKKSEEANLKDLVELTNSQGLVGVVALLSTDGDLVSTNLEEIMEKLK